MTPNRRASQPAAAARRLGRSIGPFVRSPEIGFPYLVGFLRKNGVLEDGTRVAVQHDKIEGPTPFEEIALWAFGDFVFGQDFDLISDTTKARRFGFHDVDSEAMLFGMLEQYRTARILP